MRYPVVILFFVLGLGLILGSCKKHDNANPTPTPAPGPTYSSCTLIQYNSDKIFYNKDGKLSSYEYPGVNTHVLTSSTCFDYYGDSSILISYPVVYWLEFILVDFDSLRRMIGASFYTQNDQYKQYGPNGLIRKMSFTYSPDGKTAIIVYQDGKDSTLITRDICTIDNDFEIVHTDCYDVAGKLAKKIDLAYDKKINPLRNVFSPTVLDPYGKYFPGMHNLTSIETTTYDQNGIPTSSIINYNYKYNSTGSPTIRNRPNISTDYFSYKCK